MQRKDKEQAIRLRKEGKSYNEISRLLGVSKGTLSSRLKDVALSEEARARLNARMKNNPGIRKLIARNKQQTVLARQRAEAIQQQASAEIGPLSERELLLVGSTLYWGEGAKRSKNVVSFSNSDPAIILLFMKFLREICHVPEDKFKGHVTVHPNVNIEEAEAYWSNLTKIPLTQFHKTTVIVSNASKSKRPANRLPYGTLAIFVYDTNLLNRIKGWILGIAQQ